MSVERTMARQRGLITVTQAGRLGLSRHQIAGCVRRGEWIPIRRGLYRHAVSPRSWEQHLLAGVLGADGIASHRSAATLFGLGVHARPTPEVSRPHQLAARTVPGVIVHRTTQWNARQETIRRGIACIGFERTILDTAASADVGELERLVEEAVRRRMTTFGSVAAYLVWHGGRGRPGSATLRAMLASRSPGAALPLSDFSRRVVQLLAAADLPPPRVEYRVVDRRGRFIMQADLAWPERRKIVELDGLAWHFGREDVERDRRKRARAKAEGWHILEVLWSMYAEDPAALAELIGDYLRG